MDHNVRTKFKCSARLFFSIEQKKYWNIYCMVVSLWSKKIYDVTNKTYELSYARDIYSGSRGALYFTKIRNENHKQNQ